MIRSARECGQQTRDRGGDVARVAAGQPLDRAGGGRAREAVQIEVHVAVEAAAERVVERIGARVVAVHEPVGREVVERRRQLEQIEVLHGEHAEELGVVLLEADRIGDDAGPRARRHRAAGLDLERPAAALVGGAARRTADAPQELVDRRDEVRRALADRAAERRASRDCRRCAVARRRCAAVGRRARAGGAARSRRCGRSLGQIASQ